MVFFLIVEEPGLRGAGTYFRRLFTAYDLEIFSAFGNGSFTFVAAALVMALKQWALGIYPVCEVCSCFWLFLADFG
jgi:hypothetical protein